MIKVVEGELIKTLTDGKLEDITKELGTGYILILVKHDNKLHEGYIFVENGEIIGYFYTDNNLEEICGNAEKVLELLDYENKVIELYRYDKDKLDLMKWLYPEIFIKKKTKTREDVKEENKVDNIEEEKYLNIKLNIPLDIPIEMNVKNFEDYLKDNKYIIINAYRKISGMFENGYIIYKGKTPIAAAYECNYGALLGKEAYKKIEQMLNSEDTVIDVYEYDEKKLNVLLDIYPEMKLKDETKESKKETDKKIEQSSVSISETYSILGNAEEVTELSREELLKRLGLKEPDENWIEAILEEFVKPSDEELQELKKKIENEIIEKLKNIDGVDDVTLDINVKWENSRYFIFGDVNIKREKILGIIKKDVDPSLVKFEVDSVIKKYLSKYTSRISIHIE
ncbi:DUF2226 domain-containing protein [Methanocaldococcus sp. 28A]